MSADAQTIRVLQDTLVVQQETIRAQGVMIRKMRGVIEEIEWDGDAGGVGDGVGDGKGGV